MGAGAYARCSSYRETNGGLRREWNGSRPCERLRERGEDTEIGVKRDLLDATDAERLQPVLVLEPAERTLHGSASTVKVAEPLALARDQRVEPGSLDPSGGGLALAFPPMRTGKGS
jgi:hypothetical protein